MIYLDNAATSYPKPACVYEKIAAFLKTHGANPGRSGYRMSVECEKVLDEARNVITKFFGGANPERLIFTLNATDALNIAIKGVLRKGDHVITTHLEHNSVSRPLNRLEHEGFISLTRVPNSSGGIVDPEDVKRNLRTQTRLVVMTHASNVLGTIQPIDEIGKIVAGTDAIFLVDAAQSAGVVPIDVRAMHIDLLAFPGHKALFGPTGTGGLYVGEKIEPFLWREGGTGGDSSSPLQPEEFPFRLEGGTPNTLGIAALAEGVRFVRDQGVEKIRNHEMGLVKRLIEGLRRDDRFIIYGTLDPSLRVGAVLCNIKGISPQEAGMILDESFDIAVRSGLHCAPYAHKTVGTFPDGGLRISPGYFNKEEDIDAILRALKEVAP